MSPGNGLHSAGTSANKLSFQRDDVPIGSPSSMTSFEMMLEEECDWSLNDSSTRRIDDRSSTRPALTFEPDDDIDDVHEFASQLPDELTDNPMDVDNIANGNVEEKTDSSHNEPYERQLNTPVPETLSDIVDNDTTAVPSSSGPSSSTSEGLSGSHSNQLLSLDHYIRDDIELQGTEGQNTPASLDSTQWDDIRNHMDVDELESSQSSPSFPINSHENSDQSVFGASSEFQGNTAAAAPVASSNRGPPSSGTYVCIGTRHCCNTTTPLRLERPSDAETTVPSEDVMNDWRVITLASQLPDELLNSVCDEPASSAATGQCVNSETSSMFGPRKAGPKIPERPMADVPVKDSPQHPKSRKISNQPQQLVSMEQIEAELRDGMFSTNIYTSSLSTEAEVREMEDRLDKYVNSGAASVNTPNTTTTKPEITMSEAVDESLQLQENPDINHRCETPPELSIEHIAFNTNIQTPPAPTHTEISSVDHMIQQSRKSSTMTEHHTFPSASAMVHESEGIPNSPQIQECSDTIRHSEECVSIEHLESQLLDYGLMLNVNNYTPSASTEAGLAEVDHMIQQKPNCETGSISVAQNTSQTVSEMAMPNGSERVRNPSQRQAHANINHNNETPNKTEGIEYELDGMFSASAMSMSTEEYLWELDNNYLQYINYEAGATVRKPNSPSISDMTTTNLSEHFQDPPLLHENLNSNHQSKEEALSIEHIAFNTNTQTPPSSTEAETAEVDHMMQQNTNGATGAIIGKNTTGQISEMKIQNESERVHKSVKNSPQTQEHPDLNYQNETLNKSDFVQQMDFAWDGIFKELSEGVQDSPQLQEDSGNTTQQMEYETHNGMFTTNICTPPLSTCEDVDEGDDSYRKYINYGAKSLMRQNGTQSISEITRMDVSEHVRNSSPLQEDSNMARRKDKYQESVVNDQIVCSTKVQTPMSSTPSEISEVENMMKQDTNCETGLIAEHNTSPSVSEMAIQNESERVQNSVQNSPQTQEHPDLNYQNATLNKSVSVQQMESALDGMFATNIYTPPLSTCEDVYEGDNSYRKYINYGAQSLKRQNATTKMDVLENVQDSPQVQEDSNLPRHNENPDQHVAIDEIEFSTKISLSTPTEISEVDNMIQQNTNSGTGSIIIGQNSTGKLSEVTKTNVSEGVQDSPHLQEDPDSNHHNGSPSKSLSMEQMEYEIDDGMFITNVSSLPISTGEEAWNGDESYRKYINYEAGSIKRKNSSPSISEIVRMDVSEHLQDSPQLQEAANSRRHNETVPVDEVEFSTNTKTPTETSEVENMIKQSTDFETGSSIAQSTSGEISEMANEPDRVQDSPQPQENHDINNTPQNGAVIEQIVCGLKHGLLGTLLSIETGMAATGEELGEYIDYGTGSMPKKDTTPIVSENVMTGVSEKVEKSTQLQETSRLTRQNEAVSIDQMDCKLQYDLSTNRPTAHQSAADNMVQRSLDLSKSSMVSRDTTTAISEMAMAMLSERAPDLQQLQENPHMNHQYETSRRRAFSIDEIEFRTNTQTPNEVEMMIQESNKYGNQTLMLRSHPSTYQKNKKYKLFRYKLTGYKERVIIPDSELIKYKTEEEFRKEYQRRIPKAAVFRKILQRRRNLFTAHLRVEYQSIIEMENTLEYLHIIHQDRFSPFERDVLNIRREAFFILREKLASKIQSAPPVPVMANMSERVGASSVAIEENQAELMKGVITTSTRTCKQPVNVKRNQRYKIFRHQLTGYTEAAIVPDAELIKHKTEEEFRSEFEHGKFTSAEFRKILHRRRNLLKSHLLIHYQRIVEVEDNQKFIQLINRSAFSPFERKILTIRRDALLAHRKKSSGPRNAAKKFHA